MVSFISSWAQQIIFAVIIGTILQMLLPEGKNKKYIKIIIGVYVLFAVISPVVGKNIDLNLDEFNISLENTTTSLDKTNEDEITNLYIGNLKQDVISKLNNKGYGCENVELQTNENYEVLKISITGIYELKEDDESENSKKASNSDGKANESEETKNNEGVNSNFNSSVNTVIINEVQIGEKTNNIKDQVVKGIPTSKEKELKEYLSETYNVKEKNITISWKLIRLQYINNK